jgi:hypothetical protein
MMEPMEASEREPIEAWRKSWPERKAAGPDDPPAEASTYRRRTEASTYRRAAEASAYRRAAKAPTHRRAAEVSTYRRAAEASAYRRAAKAPAAAAKAPTADAATTPAHTGIRCRRCCHRAHEGNSGQHCYDLTHHWRFLHLSREPSLMLLIIVECRPPDHPGIGRTTSPVPRTVGLSAFGTSRPTLVGLSANGIHVPLSDTATAAASKGHHDE